MDGGGADGGALGAVWRWVRRGVVLGAVVALADVLFCEAREEWSGASTPRAVSARGAREEREMAACRARAFRQETVLDEGAGVLTASAE